MPHTDPIPDTIFTPSGYPSKLQVYMIPSSSVWQVRVYMGRKLVRRSTKTSSRAQAIAFAKDLYDELLIKTRRGEPLVEPPADFETVAEDMLKEDQKRVDRGERQQSLVNDSKRILKADMMDFFKKYRCRDIDFKKIQAYVDHLGQRKDKNGKPRPQLSSGTIRIHFVVLQKILTHAQAMGLITAQPVFPKVTVKDKPRAWLNPEEYQQLIKVIRQEIKDGVKVRYQPVTEHLIDVCEFTVNSFLRPGEDIYLLQHGQVKVVRRPPSRLYLRIVGKSKKAASEVITATHAAYIYETRMIPKDAKDDDYVFYPDMKNREAVGELMSRQFSYCLTKAGLKVSAIGQVRTFYSLRHTCACIQLLNGTDKEFIARNMRTSVQMLDRYYTSHLTPEMMADKMHSGLEEAGASLADFFVDDEPEVA